MGLIFTQMVSNTLNMGTDLVSAIVIYALLIGCQFHVNSPRPCLYESLQGRSSSKEKIQVLEGPDFIKEETPIGANLFR